MPVPAIRVAYRSYTLWMNGSADSSRTGVGRSSCGSVMFGLTSVSARKGCRSVRCHEAPRFWGGSHCRLAPAIGGWVGREKPCNGEPCRVHDGAPARRSVRRSLVSRRGDALVWRIGEHAPPTRSGRTTGIGNSKRATCGNVRSGSGSAWQSGQGEPANSGVLRQSGRSTRCMQTPSASGRNAGCVPVGNLTDGLGGTPPVTRRLTSTAQGRKSSAASGARSARPHPCPVLAGCITGAKY